MADEPDVEPVHLCDAADEVEATLIVNLLSEEGVLAHTDAARASGVFGGLPFEPGRGVFVASGDLEKAVEILSRHPRFQDRGQDRDLDRSDEPGLELARLCEAANEIEATMVANFLAGEGVPARTDASRGGAAFGGLGFEPGRGVYVPPSELKKAVKILSRHPRYRDLKNVHQPSGD